MIGAAFQCNLCGDSNVFAPPGDWREAPSCTGCGSSVRTRQLVHCLTDGLLGKSQSLPEIPRSDLRGIGLSDPEALACRLSERFAYTNSFYHQEPHLDICNPARKWRNSADFLVSSDVFEHVPMPVQRAFEGAHQVLRRGGLLILTVPFDERAETTEHYPNLNNYRIAETSAGWILANATTAGEIEIYDKLNFHGGPGKTLEMRFFSRKSVVHQLRLAGFESIKVHDEVVSEWGIYPPHHQGLPITARKVRKMTSLGSLFRSRQSNP